MNNIIKSTNQKTRYKIGQIITHIITENNGIN